MVDGGCRPTARDLLQVGYVAGRQGDQGLEPVDLVAYGYDRFGQFMARCEQPFHVRT
jgi:hypothetical protein